VEAMSICYALISKQGQKLVEVYAAKESGVKRKYYFREKKNQSTFLLSFPLSFFVCGSLCCLLVFALPFKEEKRRKDLFMVVWCVFRCGVFLVMAIIVYLCGPLFF